MTISPNGVVFVKDHVRRGIMPRMLEEILNTRVMVKESMKLHKDNKVCVYNEYLILISLTVQTAHIKVPVCNKLGFNRIFECSIRVH